MNSNCGAGDTISRGSTQRQPRLALAASTVGFEWQPQQPSAPPRSSPLTCESSTAHVERHSASPFVPESLVFRAGEQLEQQQLLMAQMLRDAMARHAARTRRPVQCNYCRKMQQPASLYQTHRTRDGNGLVVCPVLRLVQCALCGASGDFAHTSTYCPYNPSGGLRSRRPPAHTAARTGTTGGSGSSTGSDSGSISFFERDPHLKLSLAVNAGGRGPAHCSRLAFATHWAAGAL